MTKLRLVLAQLNMTVGDVLGNQRKVEATLTESRTMGADLVAFPELALSGYPPEDLLLKPDFIEAVMQS